MSDHLSEDLKSDVNISNLFSEAEKLDLTTCENKEHYLNYVGLVGSAKIGKTTFIKQLIQHYSETFHFVFYLDLQRVNYQEQTNLLNMFLSKMCEWQTNEKKTFTVLKTMLKNPEKILIIVDQLDTAKFKNQFHNLHNVGYYNKSTLAAYFILNILRGNIFAESKKILVARPYQYDQLHFDYRPKFVAKVVGLTQDMQKEFCKKKDLYSNFTIKQLHPQDVDSLCAVPLNCQSFNNYFENAQRIFTDTSLFVSVFFGFYNVIKKEACENIDINMLSKFAWLHFSELSLDKIFFESKDLKNYELDINSIDSFFVTQIWQNDEIGMELNPKITYRFSSLLVQEFFVALRLLHLPSPELKELFQRIFENYNYKRNYKYPVILFLFGLCDESLHECLSEDFPNLKNSVNNLSDSLDTLLSHFAHPLHAHVNNNGLTSWSRCAPYKLTLNFPDARRIHIWYTPIKNVLF